MILAEIFGAWLLAGVALFGLRRLAGRRGGSASPRVVPSSNRRLA